jgi:hypothetical protein
VRSAPQRTRLERPSGTRLPRQSLERIGATL